MSFGILAIIGLMGAIFYIIVNLSLIRHIAYISNFRKLSSLNKSAEYKPLKLLRNERKDELSDLVEVLNEGKKKAVELLQAKKEYQEQMEIQANFDLLTGLPNRRHLYDYLSTQIKNYEPDMGNLVVMFVDLDGFKQVNDSMGHSVGDKVLQICAVRLLNVSKKLNGYISRLGGDEFILCFYAAPCDGHEESSKQVIDVFSEKINARGIQVKLGCSIGIAVYPDGPFDDPKQLIRNADNALYRAKDSGRNTFFCFDEVIRNELIFEQKVHDKLLNAIEEGVFKIHYQPLVDIQHNKVVGFEALLRWNDPELGWIRPDIFISVAEKMGVVFDLDSWVFEKAIEQVALWRKAYDTPFIISINFSPTNFYHGNFSTWLSDSPIFKKYHLNWVELEVTERLVLNHDSIVLEGISEIRSKGIQFSIDDFGIGYSSLGYIKKFSDILSKIKIDRIFINELLEGDFDIAFVKSIMMLSETLGLTVLAEGVERKEQITELKKLGCQYVQGFYYSKALPPEEMIEYLNNWDEASYMTPERNNNITQQPRI